MPASCGNCRWNGYGEFVGEIPPPLGIGVELACGTRAQGFLCESPAMAAAEDITPLGGWRAYLDDCAGSGHLFTARFGTTL